jgi:hypothetical protein
MVNIGVSSMFKWLSAAMVVSVFTIGVISHTMENKTHYDHGAALAVKYKASSCALVNQRKRYLYMCEVLEERIAFGVHCSDVAEVSTCILTIK